MEQTARKAARGLARRIAIAVLAVVCALSLACPSALLRTSGSTDAAFADSLAPGVAAVSARLAWLNPATGSYEACDPSKALVAGETADFEVQVVYSDGSVKSAAEAGKEVSWSLEGTVQGGKAVAEMSQSGRVTLTGSASKVVEVRASCDSLAVEGSPAFASLSRPGSTSPLGDSASMAVSLSGGSSEGRMWNPLVPGIVDVAQLSAPGATLNAAAVFGVADPDGSAGALGASGPEAGLLWQQAACYDADGAPTAVLLADVATNEGRGTLTANGAGDGWVILKCSSLSAPELPAWEIPVRVGGNAPDEPTTACTVASAQLVYQTPAGDWEAYSGDRKTTPTAIDEPFGSVSFDVRLVFEDGSTALASERGLAPDYQVTGSVTGDSAIARFSADGTLRATHNGNGWVYLRKATAATREVSGPIAYVRVSNNDAGVQPQGDLDISALSRYWLPSSSKPSDSDSWYWRADENSGTARQDRPLVLASETGAALASCTLTARVHWSDSAVTSEAAQDGATRSWSVARSTDSEGKACAPLVSVDADGKVVPTGEGSGFAYLSCSADVPHYDVDGAPTTSTVTGTFTVAVFKSKAAVSRLAMLDKAGDEIATSSLILSEGESTYQFYVRAYFRDGTTASNHPKSKDYDPDAFGELEWGVFTSEDRVQEELYSEVSDEGKFHVRVGFARGYVCATARGASFTGGDLSCGVTVLLERSVEQIGREDSLDVKIYHYSDYKNHGDSIAPAKEVTVTRDQLEAVADYTTWYSILRRNTISFATWYAHGVTMSNLLATCGVDSDKLVSMLFEGVDGYAPERHSGDFILGTQYRFTNFYYHSAMPSMMRAQSVSPMLALSYYEKTNAGFEDATADADIGFADNSGNRGFDYMSDDSTFRIIFGMTGRNVPNARVSVRCVDRITIIVEDGTFPEDDDQPGDEKDPEDEKPDEPDDPDKPDDPDRPDEPDDPDKPDKPDNPDNPDNPDDDSDDDDDDEAPVNDDDDDSEEPDDEEESDDSEKAPGLPDDSGNPDNDNPDGGTNPFAGGRRDEGVGTDRKLGVQVALTEADSSVESGYEDATNEVADDPGAQYGMSIEKLSQGDVERTGEKTLREMVAESRMVVPPSEIDPIYWAVSGSSAAVIFALGAALAGLRFRRDRLDGAMIARLEER